MHPSVRQVTQSRPGMPDAEKTSNNGQETKMGRDAGLILQFVLNTPVNHPPL